MSGTKASSLLEIGSLANATPRALNRVSLASKLHYRSQHQKREFNSSSWSRLFASSDPDPPSGTSPGIRTISSAFEDLNSDQLMKDIKGKWENIEDKPTILIYIGGVLFALFIGTTVVSAFDSIPVIPKIFELVGFAYTSWFVYRYLLFKSSRQELIEDVNTLKDKISGDQ